ncbi:MAG: carbohydrate-binding domain-containing protein, partial [Candidatus Coproplasma sp.]
KGNQKGSVIITGGTLLIYAACDGIDAAYDVTIDESSASVDIQIYTDKYSKYSEEVTAVEEGSYYIRFTSSAYSYSVYYFNDEDDGIWVNSSSYSTTSSNNGGFGGMGGTTYYYYEIQKPSGYSYMKLFVYSSTQSQGQDTEYLACSGNLTLNDSYDTLALTSRNGSLSLSWTNKSTVSGGMGGFGGMDDGNTDKGDYSTKGIKADNEIVISAGSIYIQSYDDGLHANVDVAIESGVTPTGNITITGGTIQIASNDDGIHSDGILSVSGGSISVTKSYEGLEGSFVEVSGGDVSVVSSDDGVNGTSTSGAAITISGGNLYVYSGGDGLDSNSRTSYGGIEISGGTAVVISVGSADAAIDNENGYNYTGGYVVAVNTSGGMSSESTKCQNFSSVGTSKSISLTAGCYLTVGVNSQTVAAIQIPKTLNATVIYLGSDSATFSSLSTFSESLNGNGVYWNVG